MLRVFSPFIEFGAPIDAEGLTLASYKNSVNGLTKMFMVLLRIAIGWHLCYEGYNKVQSTWDGTKPFSSEMYLRNSSGPFRGKFLEMVKDFHGYDLLDADRLAAAWEAELLKASAHYGFTEEQEAEARAKIEQLKAKLDSEYGLNGASAKEIESYKEKVEAWEADEVKNLPAFAQEIHRKAQTELYKKQMELTAPAKQATKEFEETLLALLTPQQQQMPKMSTPIPEWSELERANKITMYGLLIFGGLMVVGLFSRISALGAAGLLALFYISNPPWPGYPPPAVTEGSYLYVNKNLIELIACLMLATSPSGIWGGLDALVRGMITRPLFGVGAQEIREQQADAN